jgi:hypothetical protein
VVFKKGKSGNPGGRPKQPEDLRLSLRVLTPKAVETLGIILNDGEAKGSERIRAAELILAYAWGKPTQIVQDITERPAMPAKAAMLALLGVEVQ